MSALKGSRPAHWIGLTGLVALVILLGYTLRALGQVKVEVIQAKVERFAEVLALSGQVRGIDESLLAPELQGTVRSIRVKEGQRAKNGQLLASLDQEVLKAKLAQAKHEVAVAKAKLKLAKRLPLASEIEEVRAEVEAGRLSAKAKVEAARQKLLELEHGPRVEQIEQAKANLKAFKLEAQQKKREADRQKSLLAQGAVSTQAAEQSISVAQRASEATRQASAYLKELANGTRPEILEQATSNLKQAQAELFSADTAGGARLEQILKLPRLEDVKLAQSQLDSAEAAVVTAETELRQSEIVAPYDGIVGRLLLRVGDLSGPTHPILSYSSYPRLEIRVDVDESDRSRLKIGQLAHIHASGYSQEFQAKLSEIPPEIDSLRGTVEAKFTPLDPPAWILPGQTVDVNLMLSEQKPQLVIPLSSVILKGDEAQVMVVKRNLISARTILISSPTSFGYIVYSGLEQKELIALRPQGLKNGQKVNPSGPRT